MDKVRIKTPEELNLSNEVSIFEDALRTTKKKGNYEWWYFDSKFPDGSSLVIIFYSKHVTSMKAKFEPYVTLDYVSTTNKSMHLCVKSNDYEFSKKQCYVRIKDCYVKGDLKHYEIFFKKDDVEVNLKLDRSVPSWRPYSGHIFFNDKDYFGWLPSVPEGVVKVKIKENEKQYELLGTGYHDHNFGNKLMIFLMNDWYWGRAKIGDYVVVSSFIYANKKGKYSKIPIFMIAKDNKILADDAYKYLTYYELDYKKDSYTKRNVAHTLIYDYNDVNNNIHYKITYKKGDEDIEKQVMRDIVGLPLSFMFYMLGFRGSYHRMGGTVTLERFEKEEVVEKIESKAMWEQMCFRKDRIK